MRISGIAPDKNFENFRNGTKRNNTFSPIVSWISAMNSACR